MYDDISKGLCMCDCGAFWENHRGILLHFDHQDDQSSEKI